MKLSAVGHMDAGDSSVVAGPAVIEVVAGLTDPHGFPQRGLAVFVTAQSKVGDVFPGPAEAHQIAEPGVDRSVAHDQEGVSDPGGEAKGVDLLAGDDPDGRRRVRSE